MALTRRQLQTALNRLAKANTEAFEQRELIAAHCMEVYGVDPADVNNDTFIDSCDGGAGVAAGMTVEEFEQSMVECMARPIA